MKEKVCPRCGSENVEWVIPQNWSMWSCNNCDYSGPIIEVDKSMKKKLQKRWKKQKKIILRKIELEHIKEESEHGLTTEQEKELKEIDELLQ